MGAKEKHIYQNIQISHDISSSSHYSNHGPGNSNSRSSSNARLANQQPR